MPIERDDHAERLARIEELLEHVQREQQRLLDQLRKGRDASDRRKRDEPVAINRRGSGQPADSR